MDCSTKFSRVHSRTCKHVYHPTGYLALQHQLTKWESNCSPLFTAGMIASTGVPTTCTASNMLCHLSQVSCTAARHLAMAMQYLRFDKPLMQLLIQIRKVFRQTLCHLLHQQCTSSENVHCQLGCKTASVPPHMQMHNSYVYLKTIS